MKTEVIVIGGLMLLVLARKVAANIPEQLNETQLLELANNAGFEDTAHLIVAVSIAMAESNGKPKALGDIDNPVPGAASYGLWQINSYYHPEFGPNFDALFDPNVNAAAAYSVYNNAGQSFTPWSTYNSGAYEKFLPEVTAVFHSLGI